MEGKFKDYTMKRVGFSMIELVFVIVIVGVLTAIALPRLSVSRDDACFAKLRANLSETETILSREYTKKFLQGATISNADTLKFLKTLETNNSDGCLFQVDNATKITAKIRSISIPLSVTNDTITKSPILTCDVKNESCRKLTGKAKS